MKLVESGVQLLTLSNQWNRSWIQARVRMVTNKAIKKRMSRDRDASIRAYPTLPKPNYMKNRIGALGALPLDNWTVHKNF